MNSNKQNKDTASAETESRKDSHVALALSSRNESIDPRFFYEPMMAAHPDENSTWPIQLGNKNLRYPLWISSMTGGTSKTNEINQRLAIAAGKFGLGMGVG